MRKAVVLSGYAIATMRFLCLPDTVDPRAPKAK